jgi:hypothetical protein
MARAPNITARPTQKTAIWRIASIVMVPVRDVLQRRACAPVPQGNAVLHD